MHRISLALLLLVLAPLAHAKEGDAFFCYSIDVAGKRIWTTDIFPGDRSMEKDMAGVFAMDMGKRDRGQARVYDCGWREGPREAMDELERLRATHAANGFRVGNIDWNPMTR